MGKRQPTEQEVKIEIIDGLLDAGIVSFDGPYKLKNRRESSFYINERDMLSMPELFAKACRAMGRLAREQFFSDQSSNRFLMGIPEAANEMAGAIGFDQKLPLLKKRVQPKDHGIPKMIEGVFEPGDEVVLVDGVMNTGKSALNESRILSRYGLEAVAIVCLVDRDQGGSQLLEQAGIESVAATTMPEILERASERRIISFANYAEAVIELSGQSF